MPHSELQTPPNDSQASAARPVNDALSAHAPALALLLARVRGRASRLAFFRLLGWGVAASAGVLLVVAVLLAFKFEAARTPGWFVTLGVLLGFVVVGLRRAHSIRRDDAYAARVLGALHPTEASDLLSAVELAGRSDVSASLVKAHLLRMSERAEKVDARAAVRSQPAMVAGSLAIAAIVVHIVGASFVGDRASQAWSYLFFRPVNEATLFAPEPIAGDIKLTYRYPAHTGRPPKTVEGTAGDILAPRGTVVEIEARADRDVERAFAVYGETAVPMRVEDRQLSGELLVGQSSEWRFRYATKSGRLVANGPARPVVVEADQPPTVTLSAPEPELLVDGNERLNLSFEATDDYGLTQLSLVWSQGDGVEQRKPLQSFTTDLPRRHRGEATWDLAPLALAPGDRVTYRIEAVDNDTVSGVKTGVSQTQVLKVFSKVDHHREILRRAQEQWERLVSGLADRLVEPPAGKNGEHIDDAWKTLTRGRDQVLSSVALGLTSLANELAQDERAPPEIGLALGHVGNRVASAVRTTVGTRASLVTTPSAQVSKRFSVALGEEIGQEEQGVLYLEDLFDRQRLLDLAELSRELQAARKDLTQLIEAFQKEPSDEARRKLMTEVAKLKQRVHELFRRMQELQSQIQDRHLNEDAAETMSEGQDMLSELDEIQKKLAAGEMDEALKALEDLQKQLEKMEEKFNEGSGETSPENEELGRELQALASDLIDVEAEQKAIQEQTEELRQAQREEQQKKLDALGDQFVKKQRERVAKAAKELENVDPNVAESLVLDEELQRAVERLVQLDRALEGSEFDEALDQAEQALDNSQMLKRRLDAERNARMQMPGWRGGLDVAPAAGHASRAEAPIREVVQDLNELMRQAKPKLNEAQKKKLDELAKKQGDAEQKTGELQERLGEIGKKAPLFGPEEQAMLDDAQKSMGEAKGKLDQSDPRGASSKQGKALEQLQAMREAMQDAANKPGSGQGGGVPMPFARSQGGEGDGEGKGMRQEKVEIPTADQSRAPEAFRKDILDAMKDDAPDAYRERVRDYYQELVK